MIEKRYILKTWTLADTPFWSNVSDNFPSFYYIDDIFYPKGTINNTLNVNVSSFFSFQSFSENITFTSKTSEYGYLSVLDTVTNFEMFYFITELQKPLQDGIMFKLDKDIYMTYTIPVLRKLLSSNKKLLFNRHHVETNDIAYYEDDLFLNAPIASTSFSIVRTPLINIEHYIPENKFNFNDGKNLIQFPLPLSSLEPNVPLLNRYYVFLLDGNPSNVTEFDNKYLLIPAFYNITNLSYQTKLYDDPKYYFCMNNDPDILQHIVNNTSYTNFFLGVYFLEPFSSMPNMKIFTPSNVVKPINFIAFSIPFSGMSINSSQNLLQLPNISQGPVYYNWPHALQSNYLYNFYNFRFYDFSINVSKLMKIDGGIITVPLNPYLKNSFFNIGTNGVHIMDTTLNEYDNNIIEFPYMLPSAQSGYKKYIAANLENTNTSYTTFQQKTLINGSMDLLGGAVSGVIGGMLNPASIPSSVVGTLNSGINTGLSINHTRRQIQSEYSTAKRTSIPKRLTSINNSLKHMLYYTDAKSPLILPFLPIYKDELNENSIIILNNLFYLFGFYNPQYMTFSDMFRFKRNVIGSTYFEIDKGSFSRFIANYDYTQAIGIREYYNHIVNMVSEGIRFWDIEPNQELFRQPYNKSTALIVVDNGK